MSDAHDPPREPEDSSAPPPSPTGDPAGERPGELVDRFVARLLDLILAGVVTTVLVRILLGNSAGMESVTGGGSFVASPVDSLLGAAISLGYFSLMESERGQTVGKMVMRLHTRSESGGLPTLEQAAKRNLWVAFGIVGIVPLVGGLISFVATVAAIITIAVGINEDTVRRRPWTDKLGGTVVVKS